MTVVVGRVSDAATGAPVENATVIVGTNFDLTNESGDFIVRVGGTGIYKMSVIQRYYKKFKQEISIMGDTDMNIKLIRE